VKLLEALECLRQNPVADSPSLDVQLACGFTPLHFSTFLGAHLRRQFPDHRVSVVTGLFGDLPGNLERLADSIGSTIVAVLEWADLDPRLSVRQLGGWNPSRLGDITETVRKQSRRISNGLAALAAANTVIAVLPTLPLPPVDFSPGWLESRFKSDLSGVINETRSTLCSTRGIRVLDSQRLDLLSPHSERLDVRSAFNTGFPYRLHHADKLASLVATLVRNPLPKKGLITDLDNTFWGGILGEVNPEGVSWDLDGHTQRHGLYQQLLASLAETGILIGVASKNDPDLVEEVFRTRNPLLSRDKIFPMESNWGPKSEAVRNILKTWNVGADGVVFVDDSQLELAEVKATYPDIDCVLFPREDDHASYALLLEIRDKFGKAFISAEDALRIESIRSSNVISEATRSEGYTPDSFLESAEGKLAVTFAKTSVPPRALELINKTNQFNLNGVRHSDPSWQQYLVQPGVFVMLASYEDKYGALGNVVVLTGRMARHAMCLDHWVMSCRAFSRRIEHACLLYLFEKFQAEEVRLAFRPTPRNEPFRKFLSELIGNFSPDSCTVTLQQFRQSSPKIPIHIRET
jgi:FkbH-like protein